ncbi:MAG: sugar phosphate isomerase/epimerase [Anaerolineae bacterium]|nr:sugar phosphate isomerase/epimerase [Anaerolineae bacterium]
MERISIGVWSFGMGTDRYVGNGYKPYINFFERLDRISAIQGAKGIEITYPNDVNFDNLAKVKEELKARNLRVVSVGIEHVCDGEWQFGSFSAEDPERRKKSIELACQGMHLAHELGAGVINLWLGQDGFDYVFQSDYQKAWNYLVEGIRECADHRPEINIGIEYKTSEPKLNCLVNSGGKALALALATGRKNVGITLDVGHAFNARENPAEIASILLAEKRLFHLHLNDNYGLADDDMPVGSVHWPQFFELFYWLNKLNYTGWYSLDLYPYRDDSTEACNVSIEFMEKIHKQVSDPSFEKELQVNRQGAPSKPLHWLIGKALK